MRTALDLVLVLALLGLVPSALRRIDPRVSVGAARGCGLLGCTALWLAPGWLAAMAAGAWLVFSADAAWAAAQRFSRRAGFSLADACFDVAPAFLAVGAGWLVVDRLGASLLGFAPPLTALTAVHFHYAGFSAACIAGWTARALPRAWAQIPAAGVLIGTPLVAVGITLSRDLEIAAALGLAASLALLGAALLRLARTRGPARLWLRISGGSLLLAMLLACAYAAGAYSGYFPLSLRAMAWSHGLLNAFGFAACGMIAFRGERP